MKKEKGISLILLTIIIVAILILGAIITIIVVQDKDTKTDVEQNISTDISSSKTEDNTNTEKNKYWVSNYKSWGEQKEPFSLTLFDGKFTAPIDLKVIDSFAKGFRRNKRS